MRQLLAEEAGASEMRILAANFRHVYQRKICWPMCAGLGIAGVAMAGEIVRGESGNSTLLFAFWMYLAAIFIAELQIEVLVMPFSWCLPGYRDAAKKLLFCAGALLALMWSVIYMARPDLSGAERLASGVSTFFVASTAYYLSAWVALRFSRLAAAATLGAITLIGAEVGIGGAFHATASRGWSGFLADGGLLDVFACRTLNLAGFARRYCGRPTLAGLGGWSHRQNAKFTAACMGKEAGQVVRPAVEQFFLGRIDRAQGLARCAWGNLYTCGIAVMPSRAIRWGLRGVTWLAVLCYLAYIGWAVNVMFIMPALLIVRVRLGVHSSLPVWQGRQERFWSALAVVMVNTLLLGGMVTVVAGVTVMVQPFMPEVMWDKVNTTFTFAAMDMRFLVALLAVIPIMLGVSLIFHEYRRLAAGAVWLLSTMVAFPLLIETWTGALTMYSVAAAGVIVIACWAVFIAVLRFVCMRGNLVSHA